MIITGDYWDEIETEIQAIYAAVPSHVKKTLISHCYQPGPWKFTTSSHDKRPCLCCCEMPGQMAILHQTIGLRGIEPVCLCLNHFKQWKMDPRTAHRIKEENEKSAAKMRSNRAAKRPRSPDGWHTKDFRIEIHIFQYVIVK